MSIETLLLSTWEEDGFIGQTRVPVGRSDVDVLAIHVQNGIVRIGESKVREGSQKVYIVDDYSVASCLAHPNQDFTDWMVGDWSKWLCNIPKLWKEDGQPAVPWLLEIAHVKQIEVVFCCNLVIRCDPSQSNDLLVRAVKRSLQENAACKSWLSTKGDVRAEIKPTIVIVTELVQAVFTRIDAGYGRRFADHFKDLFREIHRYLEPALDRLPKYSNMQPHGPRKEPFEKEIRKETALSILNAMGIGMQELKEWCISEDAEI